MRISESCCSTVSCDCTPPSHSATMPTCPRHKLPPSLSVLSLPCCQPAQPAQPYTHTPCTAMLGHAHLVSQPACSSMPTLPVCQSACRSLTTLPACSCMPSLNQSALEGACAGRVGNRFRPGPHTQSRTRAHAHEIKLYRYIHTI